MCTPLHPPSLRASRRVVLGYRTKIKQSKAHFEAMYSWSFMWGLTVRPMPVLICVLTCCILGCLAASQSDDWWEGGGTLLCSYVHCVRLLDILWHIHVITHSTWKYHCLYYVLMLGCAVVPELRVSWLPWRSFTEHQECGMIYTSSFHSWHSFISRFSTSSALVSTWLSWVYSIMLSNYSQFG